MGGNYTNNVVGTDYCTNMLRRQVIPNQQKDFISFLFSFQKMLPQEKGNLLLVKEYVHQGE